MKSRGVSKDLKLRKGKRRKEEYMEGRGKERKKEGKRETGYYRW